MTANNFPSYFMSETAPDAYKQIKASQDIFNEEDPDTKTNEAFKKTRKQTQARQIAVQGNEIEAFLAQNINEIPEYQDFKQEYLNLQKLDVNTFPSLSAYINKAQQAYKTTQNKFNLFLAEQKKLFNSHYQTSCPDQKERDALWKKHEKNLKEKVLGPVDTFAQETHPDYLLAQAMIDYLDRLSNPDRDKFIASTGEEGKTKRQYKPLSYFTDSNNMPVQVQHDKKTGKVSEIRVQALSGVFFGISGKPILGNVGDAWATIVASHGKDVPIKIVVPVTGSAYLDEMDPGLTQGIVKIASWLFQRLEQRYYEKSVEKAGKDLGLNMDKVSIVDQNGNSLLSPKRRAAVKEQQEKWAREYANFRKAEEKELQEPTKGLTLAAKG